MRLDAQEGWKESSGPQPRWVSQARLKFFLSNHLTLAGPRLNHHHMGIQQMIEQEGQDFIGREDRTNWTYLLQGQRADLVWRGLRAQKYYSPSSMITSCSTIVVLVVIVVDGGTGVGELWSATGVDGRVLWDPGRSDKSGDWVEPGMQVMWLDFPSAWMMMVVPEVVGGLPKGTKYKTTTTRVVAIRQATRHTRNVLHSEHGLAVTCRGLQ